MGGMFAPPQGLQATGLHGPIYAPSGAVLYDPAADGALVNASKLSAYPLVLGTDVPHDTAAGVGAVAAGSGVVSMLAGTAASRPAAGTAGRLYFATDTGEFSYDTGSAWVELNSLAGSLAVGGPLTPNGAIAGALGTAGVAGTGRAMGRNLLWNSTARFGMAGWTLVNSTNAIQPVNVEWYLTFGAGSGWNVPNAITNSSVIYLLSQYIPAAVSQTYTISANIYAGGLTAGGVTFQLEAYDANHNDLGAVAQYVAPQGAAYGRRSATGTTPANAAYVAAVLEIQTGASINANGVYWSEIQVEVGPIATPYDPSGDLNFISYPGILIDGLNAAQWGGANNDIVQTQISSASPVSTTSLSHVSSGYGASITPSTSRTVVRFAGTGYNSTSGDGVGVIVYRNTTGIPALGTAPSGSDVNVGSTQIFSATGGYQYPVVIELLDTGLTAGTTYYYYISFAAQGGGTAYLWGNILAESR